MTNPNYNQSTPTTLDRAGLPSWQGSTQALAIATLLSAGSLTLPAPLTQAAEYHPPQGSPPPERTIAAGSRTDTDGEGRNCNPNAVPIPLTLLAPQEHVGRSTLTSPAVAWFLPATAPYFYRVSLYSLNGEAPVRIAHQEGIESGFGLARVTLPAAEPELQPDRRYVWQVAIACDPNMPNFNSVTLAAADIIDLPPKVAADLVGISTHRERADIFAKYGLWYDALNEALLELEASGQVDAVADLLSTLATIESGPQQRHLQEILDRL